MDRRELLRKIHLFADLTDRERDIILDLMRERTVAKGRRSSTSTTAGADST
jgi:hypothetical protein